MDSKVEVIAATFGELYPKQKLGTVQRETCNPAEPSRWRFVAPPAAERTVVDVVHHHSLKSLAPGKAKLHAERYSTGWYVRSSCSAEQGVRWTLVAKRLTKVAGRDHDGA